jgi:hypothetical protein
VHRRGRQAGRDLPGAGRVDVGHRDDLSPDSTWVILRMWSWPIMPVPMTPDPDRHHAHPAPPAGRCPAAEVVVGALRDRLRHVEVDRVHVLLDDHEQVSAQLAQRLGDRPDIRLAPGGSQLAPMPTACPNARPSRSADLDDRPVHLLDVHVPDAVGVAAMMATLSACRYARCPVSRQSET